MLDLELRMNAKKHSRARIHACMECKAKKTPFYTPSLVYVVNPVGGQQVRALVLRIGKVLELLCERNALRASALDIHQHHDGEREANEHSQEPKGLETTSALLETG